MDINFSQSLQDEFQEDLIDVENIDDENYDDDPIFNLEQSLYEHALKEFNIEDIPILQEISDEEIGSEYTEEISTIRTKLIIPCVIIDNDHREIQRCNRESNKRLRELIAPSTTDIDLCGKNPVVEQWTEKLTQIFNRLITEYPLGFAMDEINTALKEAVGKGCNVSPPTIVILEAGPAPNSNLAVHKTCEMYIEDLKLNQGDLLDVVCDEAIFRRLTDYSNNQLKLNPILGQWHTSKDICSALIVAFSRYGLFGLASVLGIKFLEKLQDVVDYCATFCVLELIWAAVAIVIHKYMNDNCVILEDIKNGSNNILK
ncbi:11804_t:CDS:2, partial [Dentiscutata heterogama]